VNGDGVGARTDDVPEGGVLAIPSEAMTSDGDKPVDKGRQ
jgi:hypothetical protein